MKYIAAIFLLFSLAVSAHAEVIDDAIAAYRDGKFTTAFMMA